MDVGAKTLKNHFIYLWRKSEEIDIGVIIGIAIATVLLVFKHYGNALEPFDFRLTFAPQSLNGKHVETF